MRSILFGAISSLGLLVWTSLALIAEPLCPAPLPSCCSGLYTGDPNSICDSGNGDGQCYLGTSGKYYTIQCGRGYGSGQILASFANPSPPNIATCESFCADVPGTTSVDYDNIFGDYCLCIRLGDYLNSEPYAGATQASLSLCPGTNDCCEMFAGNLADACVLEPNYGNGQCYEQEGGNILMISCLGLPQEAVNVVQAGGGYTNLDTCHTTCLDQIGASDLRLSLLIGGSCICGLDYLYSLITYSAFSLQQLITVPTCPLGLPAPDPPIYVPPVLSTPCPTTTSTASSTSSTDSSSSTSTTESSTSSSSTSTTESSTSSSSTSTTDSSTSSSTSETSTSSSTSSSTTSSATTSSDSSTSSSTTASSSSSTSSSTTGSSSSTTNQSSSTMSPSSTNTVTPSSITSTTSTGTYSPTSLSQSTSTTSVCRRRRKREGH